jgi:acetate kinase
VLDAADGGDEAAGLAYDVLLHRLVGSVGAMAAAAGGLDVLVLTGGIGERSARLRADLVRGWPTSGWRSTRRSPTGTTTAT